ncbi:MAG: hypothetical protein FJ109_03235 [Deltaproteobacteria bacterium]|nr:hypothetical protein [Deltaproteobacteria bacterium]
MMRAPQAIRTRTGHSQGAVVVALWLLVVCGTCRCGGRDSPGGLDAQGVDVPELAADVAADTEPPELRDVRVELVGELGMLLDLNNGPASPVIPLPMPAEFTVFATDDRSPVEKLSVVLVDGVTSELLAGQTASFSNGLWRVEYELCPGAHVLVRVSDEAGNGTTWKHGLEIPTLSEALVGQWSTRVYDQDRTLLGAWTSQWSADGTWEEEGPWPHIGGTWSEKDGMLDLEKRWSTLGDRDSATVEALQRCTFHVDVSYLDTCPYLRAGDGNDIVGTWERSLLTRVVPAGAIPGSGELGPLITEVSTYTFETDGTWSLHVARTVDSDRWPDVSDYQIGGTYEVVLSDNYVEDFGDFLLLSHAVPDGSGEPWTQIVLFRIRADRLLLQMRIRQQEP